MKTIVVVSLYDRYENLKKWVHAWNLCDTTDAKLFIVNNIDEGTDCSYWEKYCRERGVSFVTRQNIGFETGIIQDVCYGRMFAEQNWDYFIFATDDTIPMKKDFVSRFTKPLINDGNNSITFIEMSGVYTPHIRTSGFCIDRETSKMLEFPVFQVELKEECYYFEHQGGEETFLAQILKMGKTPIQLGNVRTSCMWDTDHRANFKREKQWEREFPGYIKSEEIYGLE